MKRERKVVTKVVGNSCSNITSPLDFGIGLLVGRVFGQVKVSALVVRELMGAILTCVGSLVDRSL